MRKLALVVALVCALPVMAMAWTPTPLTLSAPDVVQYDFDGSDLEIPVVVTGKPCGLVLSVFTSGMGDDIGLVENGYLEWHRVNYIDTCVYFSQAYNFQPGTNTVTWHGQTHVTYMQEGDGEDLMPAGTYTYYLWAYDNQSARELATCPLGQMARGGCSIHDETPDFQPRSEPFIGGCFISNLDLDGDGTKDCPYKTAFRWKLGDDPLQTDLLETCYLYNSGPNADEVTGYGGDEAECWTNGQWCIDPTDSDYIFSTRDGQNSEIKSVFRHQWVTNGEAIRDTEWGPDLTWAPPGKIYKPCGVKSDGTYLFTFTNDQGNNEDASTYAYIIAVEDGEMLYEFIHEDWTDYEAYAGGEGSNYLNGGGPTTIQYRNGRLHLGSFVCLKEACDPAAYMETEVYRDFVVWTNENGDWVSDMNWDPTHDYTWTCFGETPPKNRSHDADGLEWVFNMTGSYGNVTFDLFAPDGTGIGYFSIVGDSERSQGLAQPCDTGGGPYDGLYVDWQGGESNTNSLYYVGQDTIMGTITDVIGVADDAPAAFAVAQNTPNPFNPTTTINFDIPEAGHVSVDVFNVAGQKVDTLVNSELSAGNHTVTFDGANLAAGVYFYTVKAGDFSKTMKMTLLK